MGYDFYRLIPINRVDSSDKFNTPITTNDTLSRCKKKVGRPTKKKIGYALTKGISALKLSKSSQYQDRKQNPPTCCKGNDNTHVISPRDEGELTTYHHHTRETRRTDKDNGLSDGPSSDTKCKNRDPHLVHATNRVISLETLRTGMTEHLCCAQCAAKQEASVLGQFGRFLLSTLPVKETVRMDRLVKKFQSSINRATSPVGKIQVTENTVGIATSIKCTCKEHDILFSTHRTKTEMLNKQRRTRNSDYLINVQLVLSVQSFGGGGTEADRVLSFLSLPHAPSFGKKTFHQIENELRPYIHEITKNSVDAALEEEIRLQMTADGVADVEERIMRWKRGEFRPSVRVSYDMGWKKRSSGHRYDSMSGHGLMIGHHSQKVIAFIVRNKDCRICRKHKHIKGDVPVHDCWMTHEGSSKSMEVEGILELLTDAWDNRCFHISHVVADDDTTMISNLRHSMKDLIEAGQMEKKDWPLTPSGKKISDNGHLPLRITPPPVHVADPTHRIKVIGNRLYTQARLPRSISQIEKIDAEKIKSSWGYMLSAIRTMDRDTNQKEMVKKAKAVLEHRFSVHTYCDPKWCHHLRAKEEGKKHRKPNENGYYTKSKFPDKYKDLKTALSPFMTKEVLLESVHSMNTQKNESLNNSIARLCPKSKHFASTATLLTRVQIVVSFANLGPEVFYKMLLSDLGIEEQEHLNIERMQKKRKQDKVRHSSVGYKRKRRFQHNSMSKDDVYETRLTNTKCKLDYFSGARFNPVE